jgi:hypothetical protein
LLKLGLIPAPFPQVIEIAGRLDHSAGSGEGGIIGALVESLKT